MSLYLSQISESITADVGPFADVSFNSKRYAVSNEGGNPAVFVWGETIAVDEDDEAFYYDDGTVMRYEGIIEVATDVTTDGSGFTVSGVQSAIETMTVNGDVLDFTTGSISGAEGSTGITLTLAGFASESEAFNPGGSVSGYLQPSKIIRVGRV